MIAKKGVAEKRCSPMKKKKIRDEIRKLNRNKEMFAAVYDNFLVRIQQLYSKKGDYIMEHVLNY